MEIDKITIFGGYDRQGGKEEVEKIEFKMGDIASIVGPTGSGKTAFINDIELFANENTPSFRKVSINDEDPTNRLLDPSQNPIALITQHTNFLSDLPVNKFLNIHAKIRKLNSSHTVEETLNFANQLTGEPIIEDNRMTELSGGQTRSLLIADAVVIGNSPIILLDEIENAGIHRTKAIDLLKQYRKIFIFVTHDPRIALFSDFRVVMKNGGMYKVIETAAEEKEILTEIEKIDDVLLFCRRAIREGGQLNLEDLEDIKARLRELGYIN